MRFIDLTGKQFGRLTALYTNGRNGKGNIIWHCKCQCGNETDVLGINLRNGATRSCGCLRMSYAEFDIQNELKRLKIKNGEHIPIILGVQQVDAMIIKKQYISYLVFQTKKNI